MQSLIRLAPDHTALCKLAFLTLRANPMGAREELDEDGVDIPSPDVFDNSNQVMKL